MVQDAENKQAPMQRIADRAASWLVPVALLIAVLAYVFSGNIVTAVTVLVVFCPCALVLATPTAIMAAIGQATKHGVIIKSGEALEKMGKVDIIAFDKTGTLTYGRLDVSDIISFDENVSERELLALAASAEARSEHPLGKAIVAYAAAEGVTLTEAEDFVGEESSQQVGERLADDREDLMTEMGQGLALENRVMAKTQEGVAKAVAPKVEQMVGQTSYRPADLMRLYRQGVNETLRVFNRRIGDRN